MNIYEMTGYALELMELLDAEEIDEQTVADTLEAIGADEKIDSYCKIIENYKSDISGIDEAIARLKARKERAEKNIDRMKQALDGFMQATRQDKAKTKLFTVSYRPLKHWEWRQTFTGTMTGQNIIPLRVTIRKKHTVVPTAASRFSPLRNLYSRMDRFERAAQAYHMSEKK